MPNIRDVAQAAGVSISTVSRVIQGASNVLPETRARIEEAIQKLDYHPNRLAQQFRAQQTRSILVIVPEFGNTFFSDILAGIENVAQQNGFNVLLVDSHGEASAEYRCYEMLSQKLVDGIITFSIGISKNDLRQLAMQYPIVIACRYFSDGTLANVTIDNIKATKDITNYMLNLGHKRVCYLAGPAGMPIYQDRLKGFYGALEERDLTVNKHLVVNCKASVQGGYDATISLINNSNSKFTAIVASGDTMAIGAIRALNDNNFRVPEDVAVAGFDDIELSALFSPSLTTVRQPKYQIGVRSMEKLLELISNGSLVSSREILNYELIIRKSSGDFVGNRNF